ncbi:MAG TPA: hypothetical protein DDX98_01255 [Bacteroidales bacterium]|jgi:hypothetical protein|nr:hypothetical protein [Bacteroidales bacterium]
MPFDFGPKSETYVDYWNSLSYVRKHKKGTKVYQKADRYLRSLERGKFSKSVVASNFTEWCDRKKVDPNLLYKKWSSRQIKDALVNLSKLFDPDYEPKIKDKLPRNLYRLVFDEYTQMSLFLFYYDKTPKLNRRRIKEDAFQNVSRKKMKLINDAQAIFQEVTGKKEDNRVAVLNIFNSMKDYYLNNEEKIDYDKVSGYTQFFSYYFKWLQYQYKSFPNLSIYALNPDTKIFNRYVKEVMYD